MHVLQLCSLWYYAILLSDAVIKLTKNTLGRTEFIWPVLAGHSLLLKEVRGRGMGARTTVKCCLLAHSLCALSILDCCIKDLGLASFLI